jgi:hypothetical protein
MSSGIIRENRQARDTRGRQWQIRLCIRYAAAVSIGKVLRAERKDPASGCITQDHKHGLESQSACILKREIYPPACAGTAFQLTKGDSKARG